MPTGSPASAPTETMIPFSGKHHITSQGEHHQPVPPRRRPGDRPARFRRHAPAPGQPERAHPRPRVRPRRPAAVELGVNHIDTADFYRSENGSVRANTLIREALSPYPYALVIATKVGPVFGSGGPGQGTAADLRPQVEANLESLGLDRLDLANSAHRQAWNPRTAGVTRRRFEVLAALREEGLIRHLGISNVDAGDLAEADDRSDRGRSEQLPHRRSWRRGPSWRPARGPGIACSALFSFLGGGRATSAIPAWSRWPNGAVPPYIRSLWPGCSRCPRLPWPSRVPVPWLIWRRT